MAEVCSIDSTGLPSESISSGFSNSCSQNTCLAEALSHSSYYLQLAHYTKTKDYHQLQYLIQQSHACNATCALNISHEAMQ